MAFDFIYEVNNFIHPYLILCYLSLFGFPVHSWKPVQTVNIYFGGSGEGLIILIFKYYQNQT